MEIYAELLKTLRTPEQAARFASLYGAGEGVALAQADRYSRVIRRFAALVGEKAKLRFFSAPGRTEIGGNHTDHNRGQVLAAAITLDTIAAVCPTDDGVVTLYSEGYDQPFSVDTSDLTKRSEHQTATLIRGVAARMKEQGRPVGGFQAVVTSSVLVGSGLSSSAAFEVLLCAIFDGLYGGGSLDALTRAQICQWAENNYMDKPSGLMDQTASASGGLVHIDFGPQKPKVERLDFDFAQKGYALVVVGTGSSHDDLTHEYASIPAEMRAVAGALGGKVLYDVLGEQVLSDVRLLREKAGDRAVLRALHFCDENARVQAMVNALRQDDVAGFFAKIIESGESSWKLLQNVYVGGHEEQPLALALELSRRFLQGRGAWRVHGGGFAGTILAFVPHDALGEYTAMMDELFGDGACSVLGIRSQGAIEVVLG